MIPIPLLPRLQRNQPLQRSRGLTAQQDILIRLRCSRRIPEIRRRRIDLIFPFRREWRYAFPFVFVFEALRALGFGVGFWCRDYEGR